MSSRASTQRQLARWACQTALLNRNTCRRKMVPACWVCLLLLAFCFYFCVCSAMLTYSLQSSTHTGREIDKKERYRHLQQKCRGYFLSPISVRTLSMRKSARRSWRVMGASIGQGLISGASTSPGCHQMSHWYKRPSGSFESITSRIPSSCHWTLSSVSTVLKRLAP